MAVETDITIYIGQDENHAWSVVDSASSAQAMTGWALEFTVRALKGPSLLNLTTAGGAITLDDDAGTNDRATVAIADTDTLTLEPGNYYYTLRRTDAGSEVPLAYGKAKLALLAAR